MPPVEPIVPPLVEPIVPPPAPRDPAVFEAGEAEEPKPEPGLDQEGNDESDKYRCGYMLGWDPGKGILCPTGGAIIKRPQVVQSSVELVCLPWP